MGRTSDARERLITAMAGLVHRRGYLAVGVGDVCQEAGVKKGSFYHFFASKHDLMLAALDRHFEIASEHVLKAAFARDIPPLQRIQRFLTMVADFETSNRTKEGHVLGCPFGNIAAEVGGSEPQLTQRADQGFCGFASFIHDALEEAQKNGEIPKTVDAKQAADAIVAYFEGLALLAKTRNDPDLIRRLAPQATLLATGASSPGKRRASRRARR